MAYRAAAAHVLPALYNAAQDGPHPNPAGGSYRVDDRNLCCRPHALSDGGVPFIRPRPRACRVLLCSMLELDQIEPRITPRPALPAHHQTTVIGDGALVCC